MFKKMAHENPKNEAGRSMSNREFKSEEGTIRITDHNEETLRHNQEQYLISKRQFYNEIGKAKEREVL